MNAVFQTAQVRRVFDHARAARKHRPTYGSPPRPGLLLVGDHGVYLMSSGDPLQPRDDGKPGSLVAYAEGTDPDAYPDTFYDAKVALFGGDDGVELLDLDAIEPALLACERAAAPFTIRLTPTRLEVLMPRTAPRRARPRSRGA